DHPLRHSTGSHRVSRLLFRYIDVADLPLQRPRQHLGNLIIREGSAAGNRILLALVSRFGESLYRHCSYVARIHQAHFAITLREIKGALGLNARRVYEIALHEGVRLQNCVRYSGALESCLDLSVPAA